MVGPRLAEQADAGLELSDVVLVVERVQARHPRALAVVRVVVNEEALRRVEPIAQAEQAENRRVRLHDALLGRDHAAIEVWRDGRVPELVHDAGVGVGEHVNAIALPLEADAELVGGGNGLGVLRPMVEALVEVYPLNEN